VRNIAVISGTADIFLEWAAKNAVMTYRSQNRASGPGWVATHVRDLHQVRGMSFDEILLLPGWRRNSEVFDTLTHLSFQMERGL
jgi:hypothetical protein